MYKLKQGDVFRLTNLTVEDSLLGLSENVNYIVAMGPQGRLMFTDDLDNSRLVSTWADKVVKLEAETPSTEELIEHVYQAFPIHATISEMAPDPYKKRDDYSMIQFKSWKDIVNEFEDIEIDWEGRLELSFEGQNFSIPHSYVQDIGRTEMVNNEDLEYIKPIIKRNLGR